MWSTLIASQSLAERLSILNVQSEPVPIMRPKTARILEEYGDVFEGVGKLPGFLFMSFMSLYIDANKRATGSYIFCLSNEKCNSNNGITPLQKEIY